MPPTAKNVISHLLTEDDDRDFVANAKLSVTGAESAPDKLAVPFTIDLTWRSWGLVQALVTLKPTVLTIDVQVLRPTAADATDEEPVDDVIKLDLTKLKGRALDQPAAVTVWEVELSVKTGADGHLAVDYGRSYYTYGAFSS